MYVLRRNGTTSNILRATLRNSATGQGLTGLAYNSTGLVIGAICDNEATTIAYTAAGNTIETITTLGTFATPSTNKCRFKEVDATNHPGLYEIQLDDSRWNKSGAKVLRVTISGATNLLSKDLIVQLTTVDPDSATAFAPNMTVDVAKWLGTAPQTPTVAGVPIVQFRNSAGSAGINAPANLEDLAIVDTAGTVKATDASGNAVAPAATALTNTTWTDARAGYQDKLNISGNVASSAEVVAIQNNTRVVRVVPAVIERPDAGSTAYRIELLCYDEIGNMEAPDAAPTIGVVNQAGTSRDAGLDSTTMTLVSTGRYRSTYTVANTDALEQLIFSFSLVEGGATRVFANPALVVDTTAVDFTAADRTKLETLATDYTTARAAKLDDIQSAQAIRDAMKLAPTAGAPATGSVDDHLDGIATDAGTAAAAAASAASDAAAAHTAIDSVAGDVTYIKGAYKTKV